MATNTFSIRFACAMLMAAVSQCAAAAITFSVDSALDQVDDDVTDGICHTAAGTCTLRAAVMQANVNSSAGGSIIMLPAGTFQLTRPNLDGDPDSNGDLDLTTPAAGVPINIVGAGTSTTIIDAQQIDRVFFIHAARSASISDLTITNGSRIGDYGGGIRNDGQLTLTNVVVRDSQAALGGGINNIGELHLVNVVLQGNTAAYGGGLINSGTGASASLVNCSVNANTASVGAGGGISSDDSITITTSSLTRNSAVYGGGISASEALTVLNSTIAGNTALVSGGGLYYGAVSDTFRANLYNTTIAYNEADSDQDNDGSGGGVSVRHSVFNLYNTLIAGNYRINPAFADDCDGAVQTHAFNRFGNTSQCTITQVSGSYTTLNSLDYLGTLQNNGGTMETVALLAGSNAIDGAAAACLDAFSQAITTDQRGFPRNVANCDIGAYEYGAADPNDMIFRNGFEVGP
jgi:hypothetical protein